MIGRLIGARGRRSERCRGLTRVTRVLWWSGERPPLWQVCVCVCIYLCERVNGCSLALMTVICIMDSQAILIVTEREQTEKYGAHVSKKRNVWWGEDLCGAAAESQLDLLLVFTRQHHPGVLRDEGPVSESILHFSFLSRTPKKQSCTDVFF